MSILLLPLAVVNGNLIIFRRGYLYIICELLGYEIVHRLSIGVFCAKE